MWSARHTTGLDGPAPNPEAHGTRGLTRKPSLPDRGAQAIDAARLRAGLEATGFFGFASRA